MIYLQSKILRINAKEQNKIVEIELISVFFFLERRPDVIVVSLHSNLRIMYKLFALK